MLVLRGWGKGEGGGEEGAEKRVFVFKLMLLFCNLFVLIPLNDESIFFVHFPAISPLSQSLLYAFRNLTVI